MAMGLINRIGIFICIIALYPAGVLWGFNTLIEQGAWDIAYMPHNIWTYMAISVFVVAVKLNKKQKDT